MNSGQYHEGPQLHSLPINFAYSEGPDLPEQSSPSHPLFSSDGLPRSQQQQQQQPSQHFMTSTPVSSSALLGSNYDLVNSMPHPMPQEPLWTDQSQHSTSFEDSHTNNYYDYGSGILENDSWLPSVDPVPRFMPGNLSIYNNPHLENYGAHVYPMHGNKGDLQSLQNRSNFHYLDDPHAFARLSISRSPGVLPKIEDDGHVVKSTLCDKPPPFILSISEDGAGNSSREMTAAVDLDEQSAEEPYAKLIYRALMSRPNHTMVLQEIYQWFRDNTTKGSSDGKGWMNSIRHNLSMNAAFKKTERKLPGGDDSKKSTEWVLEPFAIKDGVQSTTRYRKGTSSSKKFNHGTPSRQSSSRKGGNGTLKGKLARYQRTSKEATDRMSYDLRPAPGSGSIRSGMIDNARREEFERRTRAHISNDRRQRSPLTPPSGEIESPSSYFSSVYPKAEEHLEGFNEYQFEDCQGVYLDDNSPLFTNNGHEVSYFHNAAVAAVGGSSGSSAMSNSRFQ